MIAVGNNNLKLVELLLVNKSSVTKRDSFGKTALLYGIQNGNFEICKLLL